MKKEQSRHAQGAKNIKNELQKRFPGIKFSVTSDSYAGGDSIRASWELGPTTKEVDTIVDMYQRGDFDGMVDLYSYRHDPKTENFQNVNGSAKYVFSNRDIPDYVYELIIKQLCEFYDVAYDSAHFKIQISGQYATSLVHRIFAKTSLPAGSVVTGLKRTACTCGLIEDFWTVTYDLPEKQPQATTAKVETATIRKNEEKEGIEVLFPCKPDAEILTVLRGAGFRWSRFAGLWYHKYTPERFAWVEGLLA
jgi:hypothetical protein